MGRAVTSAAGVAAVVVLVRALLAGTAMDLGPQVWAWAPGLLAVGIAWGLVTRAHLPEPSAGVALTVLVALRGPLCDLTAALVPAELGAVPWLAAALSLVPLGHALGRLVAPLVLCGPLPLALGWVAGEALVLAGATGAMPVPFMGVVVAGLVAGLVELGRHDRGRRLKAVAPPPPPAWEALPLGLALGLLFVTFRRVLPGYVEPGVHSSSEIAMGILLPAALVAWPAARLARPDGRRRVLVALAGLSLALALWRVLDALALSTRAEELPAVSWQLRRWAARVPLVEARHVWLLVFAGGPAAALGLGLGCSRRDASGPFALGLGLALLAEEGIVWDPVLGPARLVVLGAGAGLALAACALGPRGLSVLALAPLVMVAVPGKALPSFEDMRRVGELTVDAFARRLPGDLVLVRTGGPEVIHRDARAAYRQTLTPRVGLVPPPGREPEDAVGLSHLGLRLGGAAAHGGHPPLGPEGSAGRLLRLFARPGEPLVVGSTAELLAVDLADAGLSERVEVASDMPLGRPLLAVLCERLGAGAFAGTVQDDPVALLARRTGASLATVVVSPVREAWPGSAGSLGEERLAAAAACLGAGGRCLAFVDTTDLDRRALAARLAAFGAVFGERSAAFMEPRELDPPLLLLVGWLDEGGRPTAAELAPGFPTRDRTGRRVRLDTLADLGALLVRDGRGLSELALSGPVHGRARPVSPRQGAPTGWAAVAPLHDPGARLDRVVDGAPHQPLESAELLAGLADHARFRYELDRLRSVSLVDVVEDVDWASFEAEVDHYQRAASAAPDHPILALVLAALLEPLAREGEAQRFARVFEGTGAASIPSWRLAQLHALVLEQSLEPERAAEARARAARLYAAGPEG